MEKRKGINWNKAGKNKGRANGGKQSTKELAKICKQALRWTQKICQEFVNKEGVKWNFESRR